MVTPYPVYYKFSASNRRIGSYPERGEDTYLDNSLKQVHEATRKGRGQLVCRILKTHAVVHVIPYLALKRGMRVRGSKMAHIEKISQKERKTRWKVGCFIISSEGISRTVSRIDGKNSLRRANHAPRAVSNCCWKGNQRRLIPWKRLSYRCVVDVPATDPIRWRLIVELARG